MHRTCPASTSVAAYAWDMENGGFPYQDVRSVLEGMGRPLPMPPSPEASRLERLEELWAGCGLEGIEIRQVAVQRTFAGFSELWNLLLEGPSSGQALATLTETEQGQVQGRLRSRWQVQGEEPLTLSALAHAVRGTVPARP